MNNRFKDINLLWNNLRECVGSGQKAIDKFSFFIELQRYFTGLFKLENGSQEFKDIEIEFFTYLWRYGELFITKFNNQVQLWEVNQKWNNGIHIDKVKARLIIENNSKYYQDSKFVIFKNNVNGVYVKWEKDIIPALVRYWDYIEKQYELQEMLINSNRLDFKKFIYTTNNEAADITSKEINSFLDPTLPYILNINPLSTGKGEIQNLISEINLGESKSNMIYNNWVNYRNIMKDIYGIVVPNDNKKERKNLLESVNENYNSENSETITLKYLNNFANKFNELFGDNLSFGETNEIISDTTEIEGELENETK